MALAIATITNSIAALTVTGLTIKDMDEVPKSLNHRECPMLIPDLDKFVSGFNVQPDTFGAAASRKWTVRYNLTYMLVYAQVGMGRVTVVENYSGMVAKAYAFIDAVMAADTISGCVDHLAGTIGDFAITEWGGTSYNTCSVSLAIVEFVN